MILIPTAAGVGVPRDPLVSLRGDTVEVEIERIGTLSNLVAAEP